METSTGDENTTEEILRQLSDLPLSDEKQEEKQYEGDSDASEPVTEDESKDKERLESEIWELRKEVVQMKNQMADLKKVSSSHSYFADAGTGVK